MSSSVLVRVVFALLVAATIGAFFVTQRLKREDPLVKRIVLQNWLSPNGDGRKDVAPISFTLPERDEVTLSIVDDKGDEVRRLVDGRRLGKGKHSVSWYGKNDAGNVVPDGSYRLRVTLREKGRAIDFPRPIRVDTEPPRPEITSVSPPVVAAGRREDVRIRFRGQTSPPATFHVFRTDESGGSREVASFQGTRLSPEGRWRGEIDGRPAEEGMYTFAVTVQDRARNAGTGPPAPPTRETAQPGSGVTVTGPRAAGPLEPVRAGRIVRVRIGPGPRRFRWRLSRIGSTRPVRSGRDAGSRLAFRIPHDARTGLHLLVIQTAGRRIDFPIAVRGRPIAGRRTRGGDMLVVLPAITWQGRNQIDDDGDGFADTLDNSDSVLIDRPLADGNLPTGFRSEVAPLLRFLDRERLGYKLTTDLAMARGRGPQPEDHPGLLFAGSERWLPDDLNVRLRAYVDGGGKVASFGSDSFRRRVRLSGRRLAEPSRPEERNVFGERVTSATSDPAPIEVFSDTIALFRGTDGFVGLFERFEQSEGLVSGAEVHAAAGREPDHPAVLAYRLRDGLVIRVGAPGWGESLAAEQPSAEVEEVTRRIWTLLSR